MTYQTTIGTYVIIFFQTGTNVLLTLLIIVNNFYVIINNIYKQFINSK
jgi:hypothetical protein